MQQDQMTSVKQEKTGAFQGNYLSSLFELTCISELFLGTSAKDDES